LLLVVLLQFLFYSIGIPKESYMPFIASIAGRQAASSLLTLIPGVDSIVNAGVAVSLTGGIGKYCMSVFEKAAIAIAKGEKIPDNFFSNIDISTVLTFIKNYKV